MKLRKDWRPTPVRRWLFRSVSRATTARGRVSGCGRIWARRVQRRGARDPAVFIVNQTWFVWPEADIEQTAVVTASTCFTIPVMQADVEMRIRARSPER